MAYNGMGSEQHQFHATVEHHSGTGGGEQAKRFFLQALPKWPDDPDDDSASELPGIASAASVIDALKMPLAEARERFTLSEMMIMSWRSQEQYWQMKSRLGEHRRPTRKKEEEIDSKFVSKRLAKALKKEVGER